MCGILMRELNDNKMLRSKFELNSFTRYVVKCLKQVLFMALA